MILALNLLDHVIDHVAVLPLRAEHDDLGVSVYFDVVPGRPVEKVIRLHRLPHALRIGRRDLPSQDEAPAGALAEVAFQSLEKRRRVDSSEILAADFVETAHITEFRSLTNYRPWNLHPDVHVIFRHAHIGASFVTAFAPIGPIDLEAIFP